MLQLYGPSRTLCIAEAIPFTENRIDRGLLPLFCVKKVQGAVCAGGDTGPASYAPALIHLGHRAGGDDRIMGEKR
jgi:hypothetical protein